MEHTASTYPSIILQVAPVPHDGHSWKGKVWSSLVLSIKGFHYKINDYGLLLLIKHAFLQTKVIE